MLFLDIFLLTGGIILGLMVLLWLISLSLKDSSLIDIFWGPGFVLACWIYFVATPQGYPVRKWLLTILVSVWGLRLGLHIFRRNLGKGEDFRYRKWREEAGGTWWIRSLFKVFLLQGVLLWFISAPLLSAQISASPDRLTSLDVIAISIWAIGFVFEAVGDWQLARFKANPANKGKVLNTGLWRYSRHPNYFGDAVQWWAYYLFAAAAGGWWTLFSPVIMTILLLRVSGVTLLEGSLKDTREGYQEYIHTTSAFIPWFPGKSDEGQ